MENRHRLFTKGCNGAGFRFLRYWRKGFWVESIMWYIEKNIPSRLSRDGML